MTANDAGTITRLARSQAVLPSRPVQDGHRPPVAAGMAKMRMPIATAPTATTTGRNRRNPVLDAIIGSPPLLSGPGSLPRDRRPRQPTTRLEDPASAERPVEAAAAQRA